MLLQLLDLIHWQRWHCLGVCTSVARSLPIMTFLLPIRHPLIVLEIFFLHLFQFPSQITRYLFSSLAALLFIVLVLCDWHRHHSVVFACRWRLRDCSIERKLIYKARSGAALFSPYLSLLSKVLRRVILTSDLGGDFCRNGWLMLMVNIGCQPLSLLMRQLGL